MDQPKQSRVPTRAAWSLLAAWVVAALLLRLFWFDIWAEFWVIADGFRLMLWLGMYALLIFGTLRSILRWCDTPSLAFVAALIVAGLGEGLTWDDGALSIRVRFHLLRGRYESVIASLPAGENARLAIPSHSDEGYQIDQGPPIRVVFPWPGGIRDNWCGVVYDPSGTVMNIIANREAFGGDLCACRPLGGPWYFCSFT